MEKSGFKHLEKWNLKVILKRLGYSTKKKWVEEIICQTILTHQNDESTNFQNYSFMIDEDILKTFHECVRKAGFTSLNAFWQHQCKILMEEITKQEEDKDVQLD